MMIYRALELARMQAVALFVHDERGRLLRVNEPDPTETAPRFFLARTADGNLWRTRYDLPEDLATRLERLAADEPVTADLHQPARYEVEYMALLQQHAPVSSTYAGPAYYLPELASSTLVPTVGDVVTITPNKLALLEANFPYASSSHIELAPVVVLLADGTAVAICFSARITEEVAEAGVHTVEPYRGRGYAVATVRGWANEVRKMGLVPLYSTEWENRASLAVAQKLGAVQYAAELSIT